MKRIYALSLLSVFVLAGCGRGGSADSSSQSESSAPSDDIESLESELSGLEGVSSFSKVEISKEYRTKNHYPNSYVMTFETPIDWNDPSVGYFSQRVFLGYRGRDRVNTFYVGGYSLPDASSKNIFQRVSGNEISNRYDGNYIAIEYRFFYQSRPEDFSTLGTKYLNYLNSEEACHDFHNIIGKLRSVLTGKSVFTGGSKGGYTTETMAYYYPNDVDSFVSYVAPLCDGISDSRLYDYVFSEIGNIGLGEEEAQKKRDLLMSFSKFALCEEGRDLYLGWLNDAVSKEEVTLTGRAGLDEIWESAVSEMSVITWQYNADFDRIKTIMEMSEETESGKAAKEKAAYNYIINDLGFIGGINQNDYSAFPYYFQAYSEMGNYAYSFDYLEEAGCHITTDKEAQKDLFIREVLTEEQESYLSYSPNMRNTLIDFMASTELDIVKIVGYNDPWYSVSAPENDNPHIHLFKEKNCHLSKIEGLDEDSKNACWSIVDSLVL